MIQFDIDSITNRIIDRLKESEDWADILYYSTNQRIIDANAVELAYTANYGEYLAREAKWKLAKNKSSLLASTPFFDYTPHRKIGSTGNIKVSTNEDFNSTYSEDLIIPKWSIFSNERGTIKFTNYDEQLFNKAEEYIEIPVVQGIPKTKTYTASGNVYESIIIENASIENNYYEVLVNGEVFTEIRSLRLADSGTSKVYTVENLIDFSGIRINFGNGIFGYKLSALDSVVINYVETLGEDGNIGSTGIITKSESEITDSFSNTVELFVTNEEVLSGGDDYESLESIRELAPKGYRNRDRAVTKKDYESLIKENFSFVKKIIVWGEAEQNIDNNNPPGTYISTSENLVYLSILSDLDGNINDTQETNIRNFLDNKKSPTDILSFEDVDIVYINFDVEAYINSRNYTRAAINSDILNLLSTTYSLDNVGFKESLYQSDYTALIDNLEGIRYHTTLIDFYKFLTFSTTNVDYTADIETNIINLDPTSLSIYIQLDNNGYELVAVDDGAGGWVAESGYEVSGTIDYVSGVGNIIIDSGLTEDETRYTIKYKFDTISDNLLLTKRNQLFTYGSSTINSEYMSEV